MTRFSDEVLMAYADGALDGPERDAVEAAIRDDSEVRETVEMFRRTRQLVSEAFAVPASEAPPAAIVDAILAAPAAPAPAATRLRSLEGGRAGSPARVERTRAGHFTPPSRRALAMAASLALAAGLALGVVAGRWTTDGGDPALSLGAVHDGSTLGQALERLASGTVSPDRRWTVVATFRDRANRACREVELLARDAGQRPIAAGVACRTNRGGWTIEGAARIAGAQRSDGSFEPAGSAERDALDGLLNLLGASRALPSEEERALLEKGWR